MSNPISNAPTLPTRDMAHAILERLTHVDGPTEAQIDRYMTYLADAYQIEDFEHLRQYLVMVRVIPTFSTEATLRDRALAILLALLVKNSAAFHDLDRQQKLRSRLLDTIPSVKQSDPVVQGLVDQLVERVSNRNPSIANAQPALDRRVEFLDALDQTQPYMGTPEYCERLESLYITYAEYFPGYHIGPSLPSTVQTVPKGLIDFVISPDGQREVYYRMASTVMAVDGLTQYPVRMERYVKMLVSGLRKLMRCFTNELRLEGVMDK